jgi:parvulin-like peptidyl-prolyl isomerase
LRYVNLSATKNEEGIGGMRLMRIVWFVIAFFVFLGPAAPVAFSEEVARVDDIVIQDSDLKNQITYRPKWYFSNPRDRKIDPNRLLDKLIDEILTAREAKKLKIDETEEYNYRLEAVKTELLVNIYLKKLYKEKNTEANQREYYQANASKYSSPEQVKVAVISVASEEEAEDVLEKAKGGEDFAELAKKYSTDPRAQGGGDLGFRSKDRLDKPFSDVAFAMNKGEIRGPIGHRGAYHIIKLIDRKDEEPIPFENIRNRVSNDYGRKLRSDDFTRLRNAAEIHIDEKALKNVRFF